MKDKSTMESVKEACYMTKTQFWKAMVIVAEVMRRVECQIISADEGTKESTRRIERMLSATPGGAG